MNRTRTIAVAVAIAISPLSVVAPAAAGLMGTQDTTSTVVAGGLYDPLPQCREEDGSDVDGFCIWVDPDTGDMYVNPTPEEVTRNDDAVYERGYVN